MNVTDEMLEAFWQASPTEWRFDTDRLQGVLAAVLAAAPAVHVYERHDENRRVWACHDDDGWMVADREECEVQGCENEHRTLLLGQEVES